jgi:hypothetical protein
MKECSATSLVLKMEAACSPVALVVTYQTTRSHNTINLGMYFGCCKSIRLADLECSCGALTNKDVML